MELHLLPIFAFLLLVVVVSHAALPSEVYWDTVLPNTPMPKVVQDLLRPDLEEDKSTAVNVGKGGVAVNTGKPRGKGTSANRGTFIIYHYANSEDQLRSDPNVTLFFLEKDLHVGKKMNLHFTETTNGATFLPRHIAETIPFSSKKLPEIFDRLSVDPKSEEAELMKNTIKACEEPSQEGEDKYCATSLESMIDYSRIRLGKDIKVMETVVDKETNKQQYRIAKGVRMVGDNSVVCHGQNYAYAVFYCHMTQATRAYIVPLVGADGTKAKAVAICHTDTSTWDPKLLVFQVLKVKPGTVTVCHFLPEDHILWVPN